MPDHHRAQRPVDSDIRTGSPSSVLAALFRGILFDLGISPQRFGILLDNYIRRTRPSNIKEAASLRGNLKKELTKPTMSFKVFVKGLVFLNVRRFDISIRLYHFDGTTTEHMRRVSLDGNDPLKDEDDDD